MEEKSKKCRDIGLENHGNTILSYKQKSFSLPKKSYYGNYNFIGLFIFDRHKARTNVKPRCISVFGIKLQNELSNKFKTSSFLIKLKKNL